MNQNYRRRVLEIPTGEEGFAALEAFLDKICDDFHIYDDYYGNIIASVTAAYELISAIDQSPHTIAILFQSGPDGVRFTIPLGDHFLELAAKMQKMKNTTHPDMLDEPDEADQLMLQVELLADDLRLDAEEQAMVIAFHITGINDMLSLQRTQLLDNYYNRLQVSKKAHQ